MNRVELKNKAKKSLNGKYGDAVKLLGISFLLGFAAVIVISLLGLKDTTMSLVADIISIVISGLFGFGTISYFLKISRNETVTYKELFSKMNMFWPYIAISFLTGLFVMLWSILFIIPGVIAALSYSLVFYIKLDNPELSALEVIRKSKEMMNGHKMDFFILNLSFLGWEILGIFTLGILYFWLIPYIQVTFAHFYNSLKENKSNL